MSSLNPLNYSLGELKKALVGGAVATVVVLATVLTTSGVPQTGQGLLALLSTLVGTFLTAAVAVFLPKNAEPVDAAGAAVNAAWLDEVFSRPAPSAPLLVPEGAEVEPDPTSPEEFPQS
jgi:hypothetical protein